MTIATLLLVGAIISFGLAAFSVPTGRLNTVGFGLLLSALYVALPLLK